MAFLTRRPARTDQWTTEQWREHLLAHALSESERQEILALFSRA